MLFMKIDRALSYGDIMNLEPIEAAFQGFQEAKPFPHCEIDGFFKPEYADAIEQAFPGFNDEKYWHTYLNAIEDKRTCNNWNLLPPLLYQTFNILNSPEFCAYLSKLTGVEPLKSDPGLNGGGLHIHKSGGKLNQHLDYSVHPKLKMQRKINIIVYVNSHWQEDWGGQLGLWGKGENPKRPGELQKKLIPGFNKAVAFDTTMDSWHGLAEPVKSPDGECRQSLAVYYVTNPPVGVDERGKALFAPTKEQEDDKEILELIEKRASTATADKVWAKKD